MTPEEVFNLFQGLYEDAVIHRAERTLSNMPATHDGPPVPNSFHPAYEHQADFIRHRGPEYKNVLVVKTRPKPFYDPSEELYPPRSSTHEKRILTMRWNWGLAPYVGDPITMKAAYIWPMWVDDAGRWVCGDSTLEWEKGSA